MSASQSSAEPNLGEPAWREAIIEAEQARAEYVRHIDAVEADDTWRADCVCGYDARNGVVTSRLGSQTELSGSGRLEWLTPLQGALYGLAARCASRNLAVLGVTGQSLFHVVRTVSHWGH